MCKENKQNWKQLFEGMYVLYRIGLFSFSQQIDRKKNNVLAPNFVSYRNKKVSFSHQNVTFSHKKFVNKSTFSHQI